MKKNIWPVDAEESAGGARAGDPEALESPERVPIVGIGDSTG